MTQHRKDLNEDPSSHILMIDDDDICEMLEWRRNDDERGLNELQEQRLEALTLRLGAHPSAPSAVPQPTG